MSTKTIYKRIALVAVAGLVSGLVSVAPASAAITSITGVTSTSAASLSASFGALTNTSGAAAFTVDTALAQSDIGKALYTDAEGYIGTIATLAANGLSGTFTAVTVTTTLAGVAAQVGTLPTTTTSNGVTTGIINGMTVVAGAAIGLNVRTAGTPTAGEKVRANYTGVGVAGTSAAGEADATHINLLIKFTAPTTPGTYPMTIQHSVAGTFLTVFPASDRPFADVAFTLTVVADSTFSSALTTVYLNDDATKTLTADFTAATDALGASGPSTLNTDAARIFVSTRKANGTAYSGGTLYAYMTGPGMLDIDGTTDVRSESISNTGGHYINVSGDGTSGVGTVNIYMILADGVTKVDLPSKKVSFYGTVAKLTATVVQGISTASTTTGDCAGLTDCTFATLAEKPSVVVVATDANGVKIPGLVITGTTSDATIVAASTVSGATGATDYNGLGSYNASLTGGVVVGKTATITYSTVVSSLLTISSAPVTIANAGTPATVTWALDKTSYAPGAPVVITVTAKDAAGNAVGDNTYATLFAGATVLGGAVTGSTPAASVELVGGKATYTAYAPGTSGSYVISNKLGASVPAALQGTSLTGTIVVGASAEMSAVTTLINSLIAKINALNKLVIKIQKKVRA
jgi:hypothetical protein